MHVVLTTAPANTAESLARKLIESRLAACVNIVPTVASIFRWQGRVERADEALLLIKTSDDTLPRLLEELPGAHSYEVPEVVALQVGAAHAPYAAWVDEETWSVKDD